MRNIKFLFALSFLAVSFFVGNHIAYAAVPTVITAAPQNVNYTLNAVLGGGNITSNGGLPVTVSGLVWSTSPNPTVALATKTTDGLTSGSWTSQMNSLQSSPTVTYYVRAYATNSQGTGYGSELQFSLSTLNVTLTSGGRVISDPVGINCQSSGGASDCFQTYLTNTPITLTASPNNTTYHFTTFTSSTISTLPPASPSCLQQNPCTFTLVNSGTAHATFAAMTGTLTGPNSCASPIPIGGSSCTVTLNWSISYPEAAPTKITAAASGSHQAVDITVSTSTSPTTGQGGTQAVTVIPSSRTFYLYNAGKSIAPSSPNGAGKTVTATCAAGSAWNGSVCAASSGPVTMSGTISSDSIRTFGLVEYDIVLIAQSPSGSDITSQYALINYQGPNASTSGDPTKYPSPNTFRGYIGWSNANFQYWTDGPAYPVSCGGNGEYAEYNGSGTGQPYIQITDCSTSVSMVSGVFTRTTTLRIVFGPDVYSFQSPVYDNTISSFVADATGAYEFWKPTDTFEIVVDYPDLTADPTSASTETAVTNVPKTYDAYIRNIGVQNTGTSFSYFFQTNNGSNGTGNITGGWAPTTMGPLPAGQSSLAISPSINFTSTGTYSIRVCADKTNSGSVDPSTGAVIVEQNESNNCGAWTDIVVTNAPLPGVTVRPDVTWRRVNFSGASIVKWSVTNMGAEYGPVACNATGTFTPYGSPNSSPMTGIWPDTTKDYNVDGTELSESQGVLNVAGTYKYTLECTNQGGSSGPITGTIQVDPIANVSLNSDKTTVYQGDPIRLTWSVVNAGPGSSCSSNNFDVGVGNPSGFADVIPLSTITYKITCDLEDAFKQVIVKKKPGFIEN